MKPRNASSSGGGVGRRISPMRIPQIPMEWMDPMSWRLPSGKALAEFALQAGFLAPLMLGTPHFKKTRKKAGGEARADVAGAVEARRTEVNRMDANGIADGIAGGIAGGMEAGGAEGGINLRAMEQSRGEAPESSGTFRGRASRHASPETR
jgi:hypothetical protein